MHALSNRAGTVAGIVACVTLVTALAASRALASTSFTIAGSDRFSIGDGDIESEIAYHGTETLSESRHGKATRFSARVDYVRSEAGLETDAVGEYVTDVLPSGRTIATADRDPDYLTVLNQPFAARLDPSTLSDLRGLHGTVPFDFPSPLTGASLHGRLRRVAADADDPRPHAVGIAFDADGPMRGTLPDRPGLVLVGRISMRGTAFYDARTASMLSLETTVTISGNVANRSTRDPVDITYSRSIRADDAALERGGALN